MSTVEALHNPYLEGNYAPILEETTAFDLQVTGTLPEELSGRFLRIGPNPAGPVEAKSYHWFTGSGMSHGLRLRGGRAEWYRSRYSIPNLPPRIWAWIFPWAIPGW